MMSHLQKAFPERREMLIELLGVNVNWRMHQVSDGQRRRVQIFLQLLRPVSVLLLDEITTDLDVITRADFLAFLKREAEENGVTVIYATHIFDGLAEVSRRLRAS
jgi:CCR4-NOT complex subunit CAF16